MTLWRASQGAWATLAAAGESGPIRAEIYEKDYWVTQVLRCLVANHHDAFVFKGGTSLSKAYRCIDRFSEDIDILILNQGLSKGATDRLMEEMAEGVLGQLGLTKDVSGSTRGRGTNRNELLVFARDEAVGSGLLQPTVQLEMGVRGSDFPLHTTRAIRPMIADRLTAAGISVDEFEDLKAFDVPVLHPGRTLIEKVLLLHGRVSSKLLVGSDRKSSPSRIGRHYHDIQMLLGLAEVQEWLEDREAFEAAVADHRSISWAHFGIDVPPRPLGGFARSDAFRRDSEHISALQDCYESAMRELYIGDDAFPSWLGVIALIESSAELL